MCCCIWARKKKIQSKPLTFLTVNYFNVHVRYSTIYIVEKWPKCRFKRPYWCVLLGSAVLSCMWWNLQGNPFFEKCFPPAQLAEHYSNNTKPLLLSASPNCADNYTERKVSYPWVHHWLPLSGSPFNTVKTRKDCYLYWTCVCVSISPAAQVDSTAARINHKCQNTGQRRQWGLRVRCPAKDRKNDMKMWALQDRTVFFNRNTRHTTILRDLIGAPPVGWSCCRSNKGAVWAGGDSSQGAASWLAGSWLYADVTLL